MTTLGLQTLSAWLSGHLLPMGLILARLAPVATLCPLLGGNAVPGFVRLSLLLALTFTLHTLGGVSVPAHHPPAMVAVSAVRELGFGLALGMTSALPFEAARMGGRYMDLFRGASAEALLPGVASPDAASAQGPYQLLLGLAVSSGAMPLVIRALFHTFAQVPLGAALPPGPLALQVVTWAGRAMASGLAVSAPVAGAGLALDAAIGLASRALPRLGWGEVMSPLRLLVGAAVMWLTLNLVASRLLTGVTTLPQAIPALWGHG